MNKKIILTFLIFLFFGYVFIIKADDKTYINSKNVLYDEKNNIIELAENSKININDTNILIDKGIIDYNNDRIEVFGNFYLYQGLNIISGKDLVGNTSLDNISASDVSYLYNNDFKVDSTKLKRKGNQILFYDNFITPCDLDGFFDCPTWSLKIDKTKYDIEKDQFTHFNTFIQIADYKLFYLPYLSHYGVKAPRQKGFLTPTIEFSIGGNQRIITPYYIPFSESTDITITPKINFSQNFEIKENYEIHTQIEQKRSGGNNKIEINHINNVSSDINTSLRLSTSQVIDKNRVFSASGLFTNSISTTRSINEEPITFEDLYVRLENYNSFMDSDYLKTELSSVQAFDTASYGSIPISPSIQYNNITKINENYFVNELDFTILKRDESSIDKPSENFIINLTNEKVKSYSFDALNIYNKITLSNSLREYTFNSNNNNNHNSFKSNIIYSSDLIFLTNLNIKPRLKFIIPFNLRNSDKLINEDSQSISFSFYNQFSDNRFFGKDLQDTSPRIVYGLENSSIPFLDGEKLNFRINQSYDLNLNNNYLNAINQNYKFSDYAIETSTKYKGINFGIDMRLNNHNFSAKEMNYSLNFQKPIDISVNYNETKASAFKNLSNDTQALKFGISKRINDNLSFNYKSDLDVKNNYDPYRSIFSLSINDECSRLEIKYSNTRYNDNYNTQPEEIIGISFYMDYLGFFGYEQKTDLFFQEPGNLNYGL